MTNLLFIIVAFLALFLFRNVLHNRRAVASQHHDLYELHLSRISDYAKELACEIDTNHFSVTDTKSGILAGVSKKKRIVIISYIDDLFHFSFKDYKNCEFIFESAENENYYQKSLIKINLKEQDPIILTTGFTKRRKKSYIGQMLVKNGQYLCSFLAISTGKSK